MTLLLVKNHSEVMLRSCILTLGNFDCAIWGAIPMSPSLNVLDKNSLIVGRKKIEQRNYQKGFEISAIK